MVQSAALILAKSGSSRLANKNTVEFNGEPMFLINVKKCLRIFSEVYVSSDSDWILELASKAGAIPIKRSLELCGNTPNIPVYQHALRRMKPCEAIVAVQANSPTVDQNLIAITKHLIELGVDEVMTCYPDYSIYGSIWAIRKDRLVNYEDAYNPLPSILIVDESVDIHTQKDLEEALCQSKQA